MCMLTNKCKNVNLDLFRLGDLNKKNKSERRFLWVKEEKEATVKAETALVAEAKRAAQVGVNKTQVYYPSGCWLNS